MSTDPTVVHPIKLNAIGLKKVLKILQTTTDDVRDTLYNECDIIYECKECRNLFRSVENFILHKKFHCIKKFCEIKNLFDRHQSSDGSTAIYYFSNESENQNMSSSKSNDKRNLNNVINKLLDKTIEQEGSYIEERLHCRCNTEMTLIMESIKSNPNAKYQSIIYPEETSISTVENSNGILRAKTNDINGNKTDVTNIQIKINTEPPETENEFHKTICPYCNTKYSSTKSLRYHIRSIHMALKMPYLCPFCRTSFTKSSGVYKHLRNEHQQLQKSDDGGHIDNFFQTIKKIDSFGTLQCHRCHRVFQKRAALSSHVRHCQVLSSVTEPTAQTNSSPICEPSPSAISFQQKPILRNKRKSLTPISLRQRQVVYSDNEENGNAHKLKEVINYDNHLSSNNMDVKYQKSCNKTDLSESKSSQIQIRKTYRRINNPLKENNTDAFPDNRTINTVTETSRDKWLGPMGDALTKVKMMELVSLPRLTCLECQKRFQSLSTLLRHVACLHVNLNRFRCQHCGFSSYHRYICVDHVVKCHYKQKVNMRSHAARDVIALMPQNGCENEIASSKQEVPIPPSEKSIMKPIENSNFVLHSNIVNDFSTDSNLEKNLTQKVRSDSEEYEHISHNDSKQVETIIQETMKNIKSAKQRNTSSSTSCSSTGEDNIEHQENFSNEDEVNISGKTENKNFDVFDDYLDYANEDFGIILLSGVKNKCILDSEEKELNNANLIPHSSSPPLKKICLDNFRRKSFDCKWSLEKGLCRSNSLDNLEMIDDTKEHLLRKEMVRSRSIEPESVTMHM